MAQSAGWAGLGAGASPTDPRPQSSSHLPGTLPQGLLRPAGSARAQKGQDWHEITHGLAAEGAEDALDPGPGRLGRALGLRVNTGTSHLCGGGRLWTKRGVRPKDSSKPRVCLPQGLACSDSPHRLPWAPSHTHSSAHTHTHMCSAGRLSQYTSPSTPTLTSAPTPPFKLLRERPAPSRPPPTLLLGDGGRFHPSEHHALISDPLTHLGTTILLPVSSPLSEPPGHHSHPQGSRSPGSQRKAMLPKDPRVRHSYESLPDVSLSRCVILGQLQNLSESQCPPLPRPPPHCKVGTIKSSGQRV